MSDKVDEQYVMMLAYIGEGFLCMLLTSLVYIIHKYCVYENKEKSIHLTNDQR